jgi:hypothetical protein
MSVADPNPTVNNPYSARHESIAGTFVVGVLALLQGYFVLYLSCSYCSSHELSISSILKQFPTNMHNIRTKLGLLHTRTKLSSSISLNHKWFHGRSYFAGLRVTKRNKATVLLTLILFQFKHQL